ncbi:hypothetical protein [Spirosoma litoris]
MNQLIRSQLLMAILLTTMTALTGLAKPIWKFSVVVAVEKQTADFYQTMLSKPIDQIVNEQMATVNANFNSSSNFNGIYNFKVDSIYVFTGATSTEVFRAHPHFTYSVVIDGKFTPPTVGGGWYGSNQAIYHSWDWSADFISGPFGPGATDGLTHEFGHARGGVDIYGMRVEGSKNPVNGQTFEPVNSIMNFPYGNIIWDEYTTSLLNSTGGDPIVGDQWIIRPFPRTIGIKTIDTQGMPLQNVSLTIYPMDWYSYAVSWFPIGGGSTNTSGLYSFSSNPFQPATNGYPWTMRYCNFLIKAVYNSVTVYKWMPLYEVQNAYFRNGTNSTYNAEIVFPVSTLTTTIKLGTVSPTSFCQRPMTDIEVPFIISGAFQSDNTFTLQRSDSNGHFDNGLNMSTVPGTSSSILSAPVSGEPGNTYKIRVISSNPYTVSDEQLITIKPTPDRPVVQSIDVYQNDPTPILQATGQNLSWYTNFSDGVGSPTAPVVNTAQAYFATYYVSQTVNGCESPLSSFYVNVRAIPKITTVDYDCTTGRLEVKATGGIGLFEYRIVGLRDWSDNPIFQVPIWQRDGITFTVDVRQNGHVTSQPFTTTCQPPLTTGSLQILVKKYTCIDGRLEITTLGADGSPLEYRIVGLHDWTADPIFQVPSWQRDGMAFTIDVRQRGQVISQSFTTFCQSPPQPNYILQVQVKSYNCTDGRLEIATQGGNGKPIEYRIVGLRDWTTDPIFQVPTWQRTDMAFTIDVRQSGQIVSQQFTTTCPSSARMATTMDEIPLGLDIRIAPNPVTDQLRAELIAPAVTPVDVELVTVSGRLIQQQHIQGTGNRQVLTFDVSQQPAGMFVLRAITPRQSRAVSILKH